MVSKETIELAKDQSIYITAIVGHMLKIIKAQKKIDEYQEEFKLIKEGKYLEFLERVQTLDLDQQPSEDIDSIDIKMMNAGYNLGSIQRMCHERYPNIVNHRITTVTFKNVALFEIGLHIYARENKLSVQGEPLKDLIDKICIHSEVPIVAAKMIQESTKLIELIRDPENATHDLRDAELGFQIALSLGWKYKVIIEEK